MTYYSHMETINIATLKSTLSSVLKKVREGQVYQVLDRHTPIATILAFSDEQLTIAKEAETKFSAPKSVSFCKKITNPLDILRSDRDRR